jgi:hypothetical protein
MSLNLSKGRSDMLEKEHVMLRLKTVQKELESKLKTKPKDSKFPKMHSTDILVLEIERDVLKWVLDESS